MSQTLGSYIAARRKELRLTQEELSRKLDGLGTYRAPSTIAGWETNNQSVPVEILDTLAIALETSIVKLYERASILSKLPGAEIERLMDVLPMHERQRVIRMVKAYFDEYK